MKRQAFFLGLFSVGAQVLILREVVSTLNGRELFIGISLFAWLVTVALGAFWRGREKRRLRSESLFLIGAFLLPIVLLAIRLSPLMLGSFPGEVIPLGVALLIATIVIFPIGLISGGLFSTITSGGFKPAAAVAEVYLFEGWGAFAGGIAVTALLSLSVTGLSIAVMIAAFIVIFIVARTIKLWLQIVAALAFALPAIIATPEMEMRIERTRFSPFEVIDSFETPYGRQVIIRNAENTTLITDNLRETTFPDWSTAEFSLIPPLLYHPEGKSLLFMGRGDFLLSELADSLPDLKIVSLDPRAKLEEKGRRLFGRPPNLTVINDDPIAFFSRRDLLSRFDFVVINIGETETFRGNRLVTGEFLAQLRTGLNPKGIVLLSAPYDSDRHISVEKAKALAVIYNSIRASFPYVAFWPGETTLFFASADSLLETPAAEIIRRTEELPFSPNFVNRGYLEDRLQPLKVARLTKALQTDDVLNEVKKPSLIQRETIYRAQMESFAKSLVMTLFERPYTAILFALLLISLCLTALIKRHRRRNFALILYFIAGFASLSLELVSFYLFQSSAGALYSDLSLLVGIFMLGLALGTYLALRTASENLSTPSLILLLFAAGLLLLTYDRILPRLALYYYLLFLFTLALGTGSLFVAATGRYYFGRSNANRGLGYGVEILGSSLGAIIPVTLLLPMIGVDYLLISILAVLLCGLLGAFLTQ
ncbi:MAG: hypothetical protein HRF51_11475 [bacterium]